MPSFWLQKFLQVDAVVVCMNLHNGFRMYPRLKRQVTRLFVKREPRYVNATLSHWEIKPRLPRAFTVTIDVHVVRLRRYFVWVCHLCAVIDINWHNATSNCNVNYDVQFFLKKIFTTVNTVTLPNITNRFENESRKLCLREIKRIKTNVHL